MGFLLNRPDEQPQASGEAGGAAPVVGSVAARIAALQQEIAQLRERAARLRRLCDEAPVLVGTAALRDGEVTMLNGTAALAALFGVARETLAGRAARDLGLPADARLAWREAMRLALERHAPQRFVLELERGGETHRYAGITGPLDDGEGGACWFVLEEEARRVAAVALDTERLVDVLIEEAPVGVELYDRAGMLLRANAAQRALLAPPDPASALVWSGATAAAAPRTRVLERRFLPVLDRTGAVSSIVAFTADISWRLRDEEAFRERARQLARLTEDATVGLLALDRDGKLLYANAAARRLLVLRGDAPLPEPLSELFVRAREGETGPLVSEFVSRDAEGRAMAVTASATPLRAADGAFDGLVVVLEDATERQMVEEGLRADALRDQLTGLYNRRYMEESLRREILAAQRRSSPLSVVMIDLDHFKSFNDRYGHVAGDLMLRAVATYVQQHIRASDIACRYGGEELLLILPDSTIEDTRRRVEGLAREVRRLRVRYRDQEIGGVTISAGIAGMPAHGTTPETLLRVADAALYRAKSEGRDRVVVGSV